MKDIGDREVVSFKGTRQGILMSISEDVAFGQAMDSLAYKLETNEAFFSGSPISLDLGWREIDEEDLEELLDFFQKRNLKLLGIISTSLNTRKTCEEQGLKVIIGRLGLADHHGRQKIAKEKESNRDRASATDSIRRSSDQEDSTILLKKTIRSGQTLEHPGNVVILGNINPGGEVRAGGDLIVLGSLRGVAYAGMDPKAQDPCIIALKFQPTLIRIKENLTNKFDARVIKSKQAMIANLKNQDIVIKPFS